MLLLKIYLQKYTLNTSEVTFCDVIGSIIELNNLILLKSCIKMFYILNELSNLAKKQRLCLTCRKSTSSCTSCKNWKESLASGVTFAVNR